MDTREPLAELQQSQSKNEGENNHENEDVIPRLVSRIKELEQKLYGSHFLRNIFDAPGVLDGEEGGMLSKVSKFLNRFSTADLARLLLFSEEGSQENSAEPGLHDAVVEAQARKVAAQAVIELTDRLANAEQENAALRLRLREARKLSKVGQELEDVLEERDALKAVNQELARRLCGQAQTSSHEITSHQSPAADVAMEGLMREVEKACKQHEEAALNVTRLQSLLEEQATLSADREAQLEAKVALLKSASLEEAHRQEELEQQISSVQSDLERCKADLQAAQDQLAAAEAQQAELEQQVTCVQKDLDSCRADLQAAQEQLTAAQSEQAQLEQHASCVQKDLDSSRAGLQAAQEQLSAAELDKEGLKQATAALQRSLDGCKGELQASKGQLAAAHAQEKEQARLLEAAQHEKETLERDMGQKAAEASCLQAELASLQAEHEAIAQQVKDAQQEAQLAKADSSRFEKQYLDERALRRQVHEQLQVLRGNIRVVVRARPAEPSQETILAFPMAGALTVSPPGKRITDFEFNACFSPDSSQADVFEEIAPLIRSCVDGYNVCIFAYGQTGSGKTHTMHGPPDDPGIYQRALAELFAAIGCAAKEQNQASDTEPAEAAGKLPEESCSGGSIAVAMLEVYNEDARDLLGACSGNTNGGGTLEVSGLSAGQLPPGLERIPGLTWRPVASVDDVAAALADGTAQRATSATAMNASSSRSHAILSVKVCPDTSTGVHSLLHLVDLAGSERIAKSEVAGQQLKEAQNINKSLSALGDVISAMQRKASHVPFRNSKLTQVLQDSLCGSSKVMLVCNLSPEASSASETLSSLNFALRAAQVELGPAKKVGDVDQASSKTGNASTPTSRRKSSAALPSPTGGGGAGSARKGSADAKGKGAVCMDFAGRYSVT